jgi:hypothetical protein
MGKEFLYLSDRAEQAFDRFRERYAGRMPKDGVGWADYDADKAEVMRIAFGDTETKRRIDAGDRDMLNARREFIRELTHGEPGERIVDPLSVPGNQAGASNRDELAAQAAAAGVGNDA